MAAKRGQSPYAIHDPRLRCGGLGRDPGAHARIAAVQRTGPVVHLSRNRQSKTTAAHSGASGGGSLPETGETEKAS